MKFDANQANGARLQLPYGMLLMEKKGIQHD